MMKWLLPALMFVKFAALGQVLPDDTSGAVMQVAGRDSTALKNIFTKLEKTHPDSIIALYESNLQIGLCYGSHGLPALELKYLLRALSLAEKKGDNERIGWCCNWLGDLLRKERDFDKSLKYLERARDIFIRTGNRHGLGSTYNSLGDVYENRGRYDEAHKYYFAAYNTIKETGNLEGLIWPCFNIGEVYMNKGMSDSALFYYRLAQSYQRQTTNVSSLAWILRNISDVFVARKNYAEAEKYALQSLAIADSLNEPPARVNAHRVLYTIYEHTGDYKKALDHYKALVAQQAIMHNEETSRDLVKHQMQYDFDKKQEQAAAVQKEKDKRARAVSVLLALGVMGLLAAVYLQRKSSRLKTQLLKQNKETLEQKEMLMKEIHHRVKNNLQVTSILLDLQLSNIEDNKAKTAIKEGITRLDTISLIHHQLYSNENMHEIEFAQFATELQRQLHSLFANEGQLVNFQNNIPPITLDMDTAVPLGLILNELITNSYKHAFTPGSNSITLNIERGKNDYTLIYSDSGPGVPASPVKGNGTGVMIINSLSRQIGGSYTYNAENKMFIVSFRDTADMKIMA